MFRLKLYKLIPPLQKKIFQKTIDHDIDDLEMQIVRYKPDGIESLMSITNFSKKELQVIYRGFKQECPTGMVNEDAFKDIYNQFFPQGGKTRRISDKTYEQLVSKMMDATLYAHYVFNTFNHDHSGSMSFEDFVQALSVLSRGSFQERLDWTFSLYDINGDGIITRDEMLELVTAIYQMMGRFTDPIIDEDTAQEHVDRVFQKMDLNRDGVISQEEFMDCCNTDESIVKGMSFMDTIL